jgi:hypothetical protein
VKYSGTVEAFQAGGASAGSDQRNYLALVLSPHRHIVGEHRNFEKLLRCGVRLFEKIYDEIEGRHGQTVTDRISRSVRSRHEPGEARMVTTIGLLTN